MNEEILRKLSYGMYIISTWDQGRPTGCAANSVMQITASPAAVLVSINHKHYTRGCIDKAGSFAVSVLAGDSDPELIRIFGFQSGREINKFAEASYRIEGHLPVIEDCCGYLTCKVTDRMETATHTLFLGEVQETGVFGERQPMTYEDYQKNIKH